MHSLGMFWGQSTLVFVITMCALINHAVSAVGTAAVASIGTNTTTVHTVLIAL